MTVQKGAGGSTSKVIVGKGFLPVVVVAQGNGGGVIVRVTAVIPGGVEERLLVM